jgi:hypothetical protein
VSDYGDCAASPSPIGHADNWGDVDNWRTSAASQAPHVRGRATWRHRKQHLYRNPVGGSGSAGCRKSVSPCTDRPNVTNIPTPTAAGVWKPPKDETAGMGTY